MIGRVRLVAVLRDPQVLRPVVLRDQAEQHIDVAELDPPPRVPRRHVGRRLVAGRRVRIVRVHVEALHPVPVRRDEEAEGIDGRADRAGVVVPSRVGDAARDPLAGHGVNAGVDRVADARVAVCALHTPRAVDALVLREEEHRVVRLVPGCPHLHRGKRRVRGREGGVGLRRGRDVRAAVALGGRLRKALERDEARRRTVLGCAVVRPFRRSDDRQDELYPVRRRVPVEAVVERPVVGGVGRVAADGRLLVRHRPAVAAPVQVHAQHLRAQGVQGLERRVRIAVEREGFVIDPDEKMGRLRSRGRGRCGQRGDGQRRCGGAEYALPHKDPLLAFGPTVPVRKRSERRST